MEHTKFVCKLGWEKCSQCNHDTHAELFVCAVCGGAEASLPSSCPGRALTPDEADAVQAALLDFKDGTWVKGRRG